MAKEKSKETVSAAWHPDFRDIGALPDVKVVRTDFMVNFVALTLCLFLGVFLCYRQVKTWDLNSQVTELQRQVEQQASQNSRNLRQSAEFKRASDKIEDLSNFLNLTPSFLDFMMQVTETRPEHIALSTVDFVETSRQVSRTKREIVGTYTIAGMLQGSSAEALDAIGQYRQVVSELEILQDKVESINVSQPRRNPTLDLFEFNMVITLKPSA